MNDTTSTAIGERLAGIEQRLDAIAQSLDRLERRTYVATRLAMLDRQGPPPRPTPEPDRWPTQPARPHARGRPRGPTSRR